jgi:hypothetical protein
MDDIAALLAATLLECNGAGLDLQWDARTGLLIVDEQVNSIVVGDRGKRGEPTI